MQNLNKVKKCISTQDENNLIQWNYILMDSKTGQEVTPVIKTTKYKLKLSNQKEFMKKWTDRKLNLALKKDLWLLEKEVLFDILDYIDTDNIINFKLLALDYWYSASKISKARSKLLERQLIQKESGIFYLNPLMWIKTKEISQELIKMFEKSFKKYNVEVKFK